MKFPNNSVFPRNHFVWSERSYFRTNLGSLLQAKPRLKNEMIGHGTRMTHLVVRKAPQVCVRIAKYRAMIHISQYPMWELPRQGIPLCEFQLQSEELCSTREPPFSFNVLL